MEIKKDYFQYLSLNYFPKLKSYLPNGRVINDLFLLNTFHTALASRRVLISNNASMTRTSSEGPFIFYKIL